MRMGDELADAMGNADLLGASRTSQQRRNTTYPGPDEDLTAWKTQVEIALRGITDPKTRGDAAEAGARHGRGTGSEAAVERRRQG